MSKPTSATIIMTANRTDDDEDKNHQDELEITTINKNAHFLL